MTATQLLLWTINRERLQHRSAALLAFALPFVVYLLTLAPTVYGLDSAELTTGAYCLGLVHSPGYPLYLLIGHLFTRLPVGDVGYRMNLMSAFFGAATSGLLFLFLARLVRPLAALSASLLLAFSFFFWSPSLMAEVYTLHACLMVLLWHLAWNWQRRREHKWLYLLALLFGLSLGNHLSTLLLLPGLAVWLVAAGVFRALRARQVAIMVACLAVGLSVYLYLPLRYAAQPPAVGAMPIRVASWADLLDIMSARVFWGMAFAYDWAQLPGQVADLAACLWGNFLGAGVIVGSAGLILSFKRERRLAAGLGLMFLATALFYVNYAVADKWFMYLPAFVVWAVWVGLGCEWALQQIDDLRGEQRRAGLLAALVPSLALFALLFNYQHADLSADRRVYDRADRIMATVEPDAVVLVSSWFEVAPLEYLHVVEGRRPDVQVFNAGAMAVREVTHLIEDGRRRQPFYSTARPAWLLEKYTLTYVAACDCYRIKEEEM